MHERNPFRVQTVHGAIFKHVKKSLEFDFQFTNDQPCHMHVPMNSVVACHVS